MDQIKITREKGTSVEENTELNTDGFILVYADKAKIKVVGELNLRMFAPLMGIALKYISEKLKSS